MLVIVPPFVNQDCNSTYNGFVIYGKDAFTDLRFMDKYMEAKKKNKWDNLKGFLDGNTDGIAMPVKSNNTKEKVAIPNNLSSINQLSNNKVISTIRSPYVDIKLPSKPPFLGSKVLNSLIVAIGFIS